MSQINENNKSPTIIQSASMTSFDPELMDTGLDGVELYNRQLGRGQFTGELFRASIGSAVLDSGNYNHVPTSCEGTLGNRVFFGLELTPTGCIQLNGEQLRETTVGVYRENKEFFCRLGEQCCSWLTFQVTKEDLVKNGCTLPHDHFSLIRINHRFKRHLVNELTRLLTVMRNTESPTSSSLDLKMVKDHLISLFSLTLDSSDNQDKLNNAECLRIARRVTEYMEAHQDERITMMQLSRLSGKSERTLRRIFHKIYGVNPRAFLTIHRLNGVKRKLLRSAPRQTTVESIALKYGFLHLGRFSAEYKKHFGEYPSETLARK